jgi:hypothetical protein
MGLDADRPNNEPARLQNSYLSGRFLTKSGLFTISRKGARP